MITISGKIKHSEVIVVDADGIIALVNEDDIHHTKAVHISTIIDTQEIPLLLPVSTIVEAVTASQRKLSNPSLAYQILEITIKERFTRIAVDEDLLKAAALLFNPAGSKKNTLFDAIIAIVAQQYGTKIIFSFDRWYKKNGFILVEDWLKP